MKEKNKVFKIYTHLRLITNKKFVQCGTTTVSINLKLIQEPYW